MNTSRQILANIILSARIYSRPTAPPQHKTTRLPPLYLVRNRNANSLLTVQNHYNHLHHHHPSPRVLHSMYLLNLPAAATRPTPTRLIALMRPTKRYLLHHLNVLYFQHQLRGLYLTYQTNLYWRHRLCVFRDTALAHIPPYNLHQIYNTLDELDLHIIGPLHLYAYMILKMPNRIANFHAYILKYSERLHQRTTTLALYRLTELLFTALPNMFMRGLQISTKGKIGRTGSMRKQKLLFTLSHVKRSSAMTPTFYNCRHIKTKAGTLGLTQYISYKDKWNATLRRPHYTTHIPPQAPEVKMKNVTLI